MLNDKDFNVVYFSEYLKNPTSYSDIGLGRIYKDLEVVLNRHGYKPRLLPYKDKRVMTGKLSVWCRDYMPINTSRKDLFRFAYQPDYLKYNKYKGYEPDNAWVCKALNIDAANFSFDSYKYPSPIPIVIDGGNIVRCGNKVIMVDKVFNENPQIQPLKLTNCLEHWFEAEIIFLPWDKRESFGHSDGILRYISGNNVVMAPYGNPQLNKTDRKYDNLFVNILENNGLNVIRLDFSGINESTSFRFAYTNWLQLKGLIIMPKFIHMPQSNDCVYQQVQSIMKRLNVSIEMIEATDLVKCGGAFDCASWTVTKASIDAL
jgi:agmatine/peptidylarginine deiminase